MKIPPTKVGGMKHWCFKENLEMQHSVNSERLFSKEEENYGYKKNRQSNS